MPCQLDGLTHAATLVRLLWQVHLSSGRANDLYSGFIFCTAQLTITTFFLRLVVAGPNAAHSTTRLQLLLGRSTAFFMCRFFATDCGRNVRIDPRCACSGLVKHAVAMAELPELTPCSPCAALTETNSQRSLGSHGRADLHAHRTCK